jgi:hypothetical protein
MIAIRTEKTEVGGVTGTKNVTTSTVTEMIARGATEEKATMTILKGSKIAKLKKGDSKKRTTIENLAEQGSPVDNEYQR